MQASLVDMRVVNFQATTPSLEHQFSFSNNRAGKCEPKNGPIRIARLVTPRNACVKLTMKLSLAGFFPLSFAASLLKLLSCNRRTS